jgi:regulator of replication initiation timing
VVKKVSEQTLNPASPVMQQISMLNLRINDMMTQLNTVMKIMMEENAALKKENAELKAKPKETPKTK